MSFWGVKIDRGGSCTCKCNIGVPKKIRITQATPMPRPYAMKPATWTTIVYCSVGNKPPIALCALLDNSKFLDFEFEESEDITFSVEGIRGVHLAGYYVTSANPKPFPWKKIKLPKQGLQLSTENEDSDKSVIDALIGSNFMIICPKDSQRLVLKNVATDKDALEQMNTTISAFEQVSVEVDRNHDTQKGEEVMHSALTAIERLDTEFTTTKQPIMEGQIVGSSIGIDNGRQEKITEITGMTPDQHENGHEPSTLLGMKNCEKSNAAAHEELKIHEDGAREEHNQVIGDSHFCNSIGTDNNGHFSEKLTGNEHKEFIFDDNLEVPDSPISQENGTQKERIEEATTTVRKDQLIADSIPLAVSNVKMEKKKRNKSHKDSRSNNGSVVKENENRATNDGLVAVFLKDHNRRQDITPTVAIKKVNEKKRKESRKTSTHDQLLNVSIPLSNNEIGHREKLDKSEKESTEFKASHAKESTKDNMQNQNLCTENSQCNTHLSGDFFSKNIPGELVEKMADDSKVTETNEKKRKSSKKSKITWNEQLANNDDFAPNAVPEFGCSAKQEKKKKKRKRVENSHGDSQLRDDVGRCINNEINVGSKKHFDDNGQTCWNEKQEEMEIIAPSKLHIDVDNTTSRKIVCCLPATAR